MTEIIANMSNLDTELDMEASKQLSELITYNDIIDAINNSDIKLLNIYLDICKDEDNSFIKNGKDYMLKVALSQSTLDIQILEAILKNGANPNYIESFDFPLKIIVSRHPSRYDIINLFLYYGAYINFTNYLGNTALMYACFSNDQGMITHLMNNGANPHIINKYNESALSIYHRQNKQDNKRTYKKKNNNSRK